jgi:hypothetical protein
MQHTKRKLEYIFFIGRELQPAGWKMVLMAFDLF